MSRDLPTPSPRQSPSRLTSLASPQPPPYRPPNSLDLAYLGKMPTPTVRQLVEPNHSGEAGTTTAPPQDTQSSSAINQSHQIPTSATSAVIASRAASLEDPDPPLYDSRTFPSLLPPNAVLSSASRQWEGTTAQGVQIRRKDTWVIGQGWGRHMRVFEGLGARRPTSATEGCQPSRTNEARNRGFEGGEIKRHRSC